MTPVELALAVAWGVLFALFAYERWKTPRSVLDERDLVCGVGTDLLRAIVNDNRVTDCDLIGSNKQSPNRTPRGSPAKSRTSWIRNNGRQARRREARF